MEEEAVGPANAGECRGCGGKGGGWEEHPYGGGGGDRGLMDRKRGKGITFEMKIKNYNGLERWLSGSLCRALS